MKHAIEISTSRRIELKEITRQVQEAVQATGIEEGLCVIYCPHTTAGLLINENADPDVCADLERAFEEAVPDVHFDHVEGNSPSHFLASITGSSLHVLLEGSRLQLGRWQGLFFCEFDGPRRRNLWIQVLRV